MSIPQLVRDAKPDYTAGAMRAKVQGVVVLECVVLPDGTIGNITIIKSLDKVFGLDQEAVKAARQWRFLPGPPPRTTGASVRDARVGVHTPLVVGKAAVSCMA